MDKLSTERRSWNMARIQAEDTRPEVRVRSILHRMGYRFRLHLKELPGTPDIVLFKYRTVVLVHGCFWHRHCGCKYAYNPKSRADFWREKFANNVKNDIRVKRQLKVRGWKVVTVWECQVPDIERLTKRLSTEIG